MVFIINFLNTLLPILYFTCTYLYGAYFFRNDDFAEKYMSRILQFTVAIHFLDVILRWYHFDHFPLASIFEALTVIGLAAILVYLYLEFRIKVKTTGFFILVFIFILQLISSAFIDFTESLPEILKNRLFVFHTSAAILGYSGFAISFLYSLMYLLLFHNIKKSRFGVIYSRLPSLEVLSSLNYYSATFGFFFLTAAIVLGGIWANKIWGQFLSTDPKIVVAYLTWFIYGLEIFSGRFLNWSSKKLAYLSMSGFAIILFSMVAVNLFLTSFHEFQ
ncbi:MAG: hypothetical protein EH225_00025 [Calditrichaeota bacterium]|nr:cytochrome c biogenesis protein CcsA [Calditrichota bacterium]RQW08640.1 MAG: hypothetical protein EH225_00025 [Calditrichota bacterium]